MNTETKIYDWQSILKKLRSEYGHVAFESWLRHIRFMSYENGVLCLSTPTPTLQKWTNSQYTQRIQSLWAEQYPDIHQVNIACVPMHAVNDELDTPIEGGYPPHGIWHTHNDSTITYTPNMSQTFDTYVMNDTNKMAFKAAQMIATDTAEFNLLYICGGVGLGKTHLLHAVANTIQATEPQKNVLYLTAERFMNLFTKSIREKTITHFKDALRSCDVLLIDDIHFIASKTGTQEEFFHTFNDLIDQNCKIVMSGNLPPAYLQNFDERIISRMNWGIVAEIKRTDYALRCHILQAKAKQVSCDLPDNIIHLMAERITSNTRELEGSLKRISTYTELMDIPITEQTVCQILHDILSMNTKHINVQDIQNAIAKYYNISVKDLLSKSRMQSVARPRQLAIYICKNLTTDSLPKIGKAFGGRDHTTVMHAIRRIEGLLEKDDPIKQDMEKITRTLKI